MTRTGILPKILGHKTMIKKDQGRIRLMAKFMLVPCHQLLRRLLVGVGQIREDPCTPMLEGWLKATIAATRDQVNETRFFPAAIKRSSQPAGDKRNEIEK